MMGSLYIAAASLLGAIVGSFLNVVIYRLPRGAFFSDGARSVCANPECRQPIRWFDNVPIFGWLCLRGRARCCGFAISGRYPLVEALTALLFGLLWIASPHGTPINGGVVDSRALLAFGLYAFLGANLIANSFIDIDHRILPDVLTKSGMAMGLVGSMVVPGLAGRCDIVGLSPIADSLLTSALGLSVGFGLTQAVRLSARVIFRKDAMGFGDVKLMGAIGAFLGWQDVLLTFFLGCVFGAVIGVIHRWRTKDAYICFGPFLAAGALVALLVGDRLHQALEAVQLWQQSSANAPWIAAVFAVASSVLLVLLVRRGRAS